MKIVYVHGFNSSELCFKYLQSQLPQHDVVNVNYSSHQPLERSIIQVYDQLPVGETFSIIGHSLGGVISAIVSSVEGLQVQNLVTISAPLGGSKAANFIRWVPGYPQVMHDITPTSRLIRTVQNLNLKIPTLNIISTGGHLNSTSEPNDSVVTLRSQEALSFGVKHRVRANHFEVLNHESTVQTIEDFLFKEASHG